MEIVKKYFKIVGEALSSAFIYSNAELFDEDFRKLLQIFYFFGFYRPVPSTKRMVYGTTMFLLLMTSYFLGFTREAVVSLSDGNVKQTLIAIAYSMAILSFLVLIVTFMVNQTDVVDLIKVLSRMHEYEDESLIEPYRRFCCRLEKFYKIYLFGSVTVGICVTLSGIKIFKLFIPVLYDEFAEGYFYIPLMLVNLIQVYCVSSIVITSDLLHILCMIRAGANYEILSEKIRCCADNEHAKENEKELIACMKYHWAITKETKNIKKVFSKYFMSTVYGTILFLACSLYILMKTNIRDELILSIFGAVGVSLALFRIGSICFVAEWLKEKSADLLDASYDCKWFDQPKSFTRSLMIMRYFCLKEVKIDIVKFEFSRKSFYEIVSTSYNYFNNMSHTIDVMEKQHA